MGITYRDMGVSGISLGIGGRENSVDQNKCSNNFSGQTNALAIAILKLVYSPVEVPKQSLLEPLHHPHTANGSQTLRHHVQQCPEQRHSPGQKQPKSHCWINVPT